MVPTTETAETGMLGATIYRHIACRALAGDLPVTEGEPLFSAENGPSAVGTRDPSGLVGVSMQRIR